MHFFIDTEVVLKHICHTFIIMVNAGMIMIVKLNFFQKPAEIELKCLFNILLEKLKSHMPFIVTQQILDRMELVCMNTCCLPPCLVFPTHNTIHMYCKYILARGKFTRICKNLSYSVQNFSML